MITKKQYKRIGKGDYGALIGGIEDLLGVFNEDKFDMGYQSCLADMEIISTRLADHILETSMTKGHRDRMVFYLEHTELVETIKQFYKEQLNGK